MDERFKMHRLYATRISAILGAILAGFWFGYDFYLQNILRWDLFSILIIMAVAKLSAMAYFKRTN